MGIVSAMVGGDNGDWHALADRAVTALEKFVAAYEAQVRKEISSDKQHR